jgi:hypothetical protein
VSHGLDDDLREDLNWFIDSMAVQIFWLCVCRSRGEDVVYLRDDEIRAGVLILKEVVYIYFALFLVL